MKSSNYTRLEDLSSKFHTGYIIVDNTLFHVDRGLVVDSYRIYGRTIEAKVRDARTQAELGNRRLVVVDTNGMYSEVTIRNEGELITTYEAFDRLSKEEQDDVNGLLEYFMNH